MPAVFKNFIIWFLVFLLGFTIYSTSQGRMFATKDLQKASNWYPSYSNVLLNLNDRFLASESSEQNIQPIKKRAIQALIKAPLSHKPFLQLGEARVSQNSLLESRALFLQSHERNIRNRRALRALVNIDAALGNYSEAVDSLNILLSLNGEVSHIKEYQNAMLGLSNDDSARTRINELLGERPVWGNEYLQNRISRMTQKDVVDIGESVVIFSNDKSDETDTVLHTQYLNALYKAGNIDEAYDYWIELAEDPISRGATIYNPTFERKKELPPFNWLEVDGAKYFSEIDQGGGLYTSYADRNTRLMTEQVTMLNPGESYSLKINAEWSYKQRQGMFFWSLKCLNSETIITELRFDDEAKAGSGGEIEFRVPSSGCERQSLGFFAMPGQYSQRIWSLTHSLNLVPLE